MPDGAEGRIRQPELTRLGQLHDADHRGHHGDNGRQRHQGPVPSPAQDPSEWCSAADERSVARAGVGSAGEQAVRGDLNDLGVAEGVVASMVLGDLVSALT